MLTPRSLSGLALIIFLVFFVAAIPARVPLEVAIAMGVGAACFMVLVAVIIKWSTRP